MTVYGVCPPTGDLLGVYSLLWTSYKADFEFDFEDYEWMDGWSKVEIIFGVFIFAFIRSLTREVGSSPRRGAADGGRGSRAGTHCVVLHLKITTKHNHEAFRKVTLQQLLSSAVFQSILLRTSVFM